MKNWEYEELLGAVKRTLIRVMGEGVAYKDAFGTTSYEFESVCSEGKIENALVNLSLAEIAIENGVIFSGYIPLIREAFDAISDENLSESLMHDDMLDFIKRRDEAIQKMDKIEIYG